MGRSWFSSSNADTICSVIRPRPYANEHPEYELTWGNISRRVSRRISTDTDRVIVETITLRDCDQPSRILAAGKDTNDSPVVGFQL